MSWFFSSFPLNDSDVSENHASQSVSPEQNSGMLGGAGVKDDLSAIGQTLGRQLRDVASFFAPPPSQPYSSSSSEKSSDSSQMLAGIRNDLVEIRGSFKSSLSLLSTNVSGLSKLAANLLPIQQQPEEDHDDQEATYAVVPGITDEVVDFVKRISERPECWTDFPLRLDDDFSFCEAQREHAKAIEQLVPTFVSLRVNLCIQMSMEKFWMIYFILLLPRLEERDFELLSTPKIVESRDILLQKLQSKKTSEIENSEEFGNLNAFQEISTPVKAQGVNIQGEKCLTEVLHASENLESGEANENTDGEMRTEKVLQNEEDVSFSDLEDDDSDLSFRASSSRKTQYGGMLPGDSNDWVRLSTEIERRQQKPRQLKGKDSGDESSDWFNVDEFD